MHQLHTLHQLGCWKLGKLVGREGAGVLGAGVGMGVGVGVGVGDEPVAALNLLDMAFRRYLHQARQGP
jgi:hypothetical protein